jgi:putative transposase
MPRIARVAIEGLPYHITQRGNARQTVFSTPEDYRLYLDLLRHHTRDTGLSLWGYCLMPNHVHLIAVPRTTESMARALGRTHAGYAQYFNLRRVTCGHVWQARYYSCPMEDAHLWRALAYVERNPVRAGLVEHASAYPWSSAAAHLSGRDDRALLDLVPWRQRYTAERWAQVLRAGVDEEGLGQRIHEASRRGRPLGSDRFVTELEHRSGRTLRPQARGPNRAAAAGKGD